MNTTSLNLGALRQRLEETIAWYVARKREILASGTTDPD